MLTDEQRKALNTAISAMTRLGWTHPVPVLQRMLAASAAPAEGREMIPLTAIASMLSRAMAQAVANGADSRSMPDDYVAIAHFVSYPERYALATAPTMSEADVQQGDTWHYRVSKGATLSTGYIAEKSGRTVLVKQHQFSAYGNRCVTGEIEWIERIDAVIDRAAVKGESDA